MFRTEDRKVDIEYPCRWVYKVIGQDEGLIRNAIDGILGDRHYQATVSNRSKTGKYICLNIEMLIYNEENRIALYEALKSQPAVTMVL